FECMKVVTNQGHGPYFPEGAAKINHSAYESYGLTGKVLDTRDNKHYPYTCKIRHGEVVDWRVTKASNHSDKNTAIAAGAGILAIAAIVAASKDEKHKDHDKGASAFDDMRYLKKQCRQNIRRHIANEDQAVKRIHLDTTHLHNRTLVGEGGVLFKRGGGSDISYECKFDRRGRIYDGHYRFH
ncbi:MAG: hypothetical protein U9R26_01350, partial [Campylobacterota bacterium]|nr:hypothetical protein [Campylobacterota bacterium]